MSTLDRPTTLPPLVAGQRLDRATFHARYEAMPPGTRAELIGGIVCMPSPTAYPHGNAHANIVGWLFHFRGRTPGVQVCDNTSTFLDDEAEPQPDALLRISPDCGGQSSNAGKYIDGAPELIAEVADSSRSIDLGAKRADYERAGVQEYVVHALRPAEVFWHVRQGDQLVRIPPDPDGLYRSRVFPGLWLDPAALLADDVPALLAALDRGLATAEHAAFVARLAEARANAPAQPEAEDEG